MAMQLSYQLDLGEILELNRSSRYQRTKGAVIMAMGAAHLLVTAWMVYDQTEGTYPMYGAVVGSILILMGISAPTMAGLGAWVLGRAPKMCIDVSELGIRCEDL